MPTEFFQLTIRPLVVASPILLMLASCGTSHVGEAWQCPLVQGTRCVDVEAADPAVRPVSVAIGLPSLALDAGAAVEPNPAAANPANLGANPTAAPERPSLNPLVALWRWLTGDGSPDSAIGGTENSGGSGDAVDFAPKATVEAGESLETASAETARVSFPDSAEPENVVAAGSGNALPSGANVPAAATIQIPPPASVRIPEKTGRIWIAPWVDANGVYREGAWVRVVISPAAWRLP